MPESKPESKQPAFDLEISDLPGAPRAPAFVRALAVRPRLRSRLWRAATVGLALTLLFVSLSGSFPRLEQSFLRLFTHAAPTTAAEVQVQSVIAEEGVTSQINSKKVIVWFASTPPVVPLTAALDPLPRYCLHYTSTLAFAAPSFPPGVGSGPMWVTGFAGQSGQRAVLNHLRRAKPPQFGWYEQLQLVSETNFSGSITLQGGAQGGGLPLWFGAYPPGGSSDVAGLIPIITTNPLDASVSNHTTGDQQWGTRLINLYIAQAGCYYLEATWAGGSWIAYFEAGK
jgi:hypothetical protein